MTLAQASAPTQKSVGDREPTWEFAVATIKPSAPTGPLGFTSYPSGRVEIGGEPLVLLIAYAFDLQKFQIKGGPAWATTDRYDLVAEPDMAPGNAVTTVSRSFRPSRQQQMALQKLLVERFALKFHIEQRQGPVYFLTRGPGPLGLQPPKNRLGLQGVAIVQRGEIFSGEAFGINTTTELLARVLGADLERPVIDQTGLTDLYDFRLPAFDRSNTDVALAVFKDMERLGLKLKRGKGLVETLVIDSAQRPTPN